MTFLYTVYRYRIVLYCTSTTKETIRNKERLVDNIFYPAPIMILPGALHASAGFNWECKTSAGWQKDERDSMTDKQCNYFNAGGHRGLKLWPSQSKGQYEDWGTQYQEIKNLSKREGSEQSRVTVSLKTFCARKQRRNNLCPCQSGIDWNFWRLSI